MALRDKVKATLYIIVDVEYTIEVELDHLSLSDKPEQLRGCAEQQAEQLRDTAEVHLSGQTDTWGYQSKGYSVDEIHIVDTH